MKDNRIVEFYVNNQLVKTCNINNWDKTLHSLENIIEKHLYYQMYFSQSNNIYYEFSDKRIYVNPYTYKTIIFFAKIFTGFTDKNGNKLYEDDEVQTPFGFNSRIHKHWDGNNHYVRNVIGDWKWKDYTIDNFKKYVKIEDVMYMPKKLWKNNELVNIKTLLA